MTDFKKESLAGERCWSRIGIWGHETPRCEKLSEVIHCRNCGIYSKAGRTLFDRETFPEYLAEWTQILAEPKAIVSQNEISVLIFRLGEEWLAIKTEICKEIREVRPVHRVPHRNDKVLIGITNIRGDLELCISLSELFGVEEKTTPPSHLDPARSKRMIVIEQQGSLWVFPVDEIYGICRYTPNQQENLPVTLSKATATFTKALFTVDSIKVGHLDEDLLFSALSRRMA